MQQITKKNEYFDLCELLRGQLFKNIGMTKKDNNAFPFGSIVMCLMMYFLKLLPLEENFVWDSTTLVGK
jgi:hypothetical protein